MIPESLSKTSTEPGHFFKLLKDSGKSVKNVNRTLVKIVKRTRKVCQKRQQSFESLSNI